MLDTVSKTEDKAIRVIGTQVYSQIAPRSVESSYAFGRGQGREEQLGPDKTATLEGVLEDGGKQLISLFKLEDNFEYPCRIPGGGIGRSQPSPGGGGMF